MLRAQLLLDNTPLEILLSNVVFQYIHQLSEHHRAGPIFQLVENKRDELVVCTSPSSSHPNCKRSLRFIIIILTLGARSGYRC